MVIQVKHNSTIGTAYFVHNEVESLRTRLQRTTAAAAAAVITASKQNPFERTKMRCEWICTFMRSNDTNMHCITRETKSACLVVFTVNKNNITRLLPQAASY